MPLGLAVDPSPLGHIAVLVASAGEVGVDVYRSSNFGSGWAHAERVDVGTRRPSIGLRTGRSTRRHGP